MTITRGPADALLLATRLFASVLGDTMTADSIGPMLTCSQADRLTTGLLAMGQRAAARTLLVGHAMGDDEHRDDHHGLSHVIDGPEDLEHLECAGRCTPVSGRVGERQEVAVFLRLLADVANLS